MTPSLSVVIISKDEPALADTLEGLASRGGTLEAEVIVVDASDGRLDGIRFSYPNVRWIDFTSSSDKQVTIPEQRNVGVRASSGEVVIFIDAGCIPGVAWLDRLVQPICSGNEAVTAGRTLGTGSGSIYTPLPDAPTYLIEAPTINLAFTRDSFDAVGGFDENFDYGSDIDFTWRLRQAGYRLLLVGDAVVTHDWGGSSRQLRRAFRYGHGRARLYSKHPAELGQGLRRDVILFVYPLYLAILPLTMLRRFRWLPALALVPMWRARNQRPLLTLADHCAYGAGAWAFIMGLRR